MLCLVGIPGRSAFFRREKNGSGPKGEWRLGRSGGRGGCSQNVLYERRIKVTNSREGLDVTLDYNGGGVFGWLARRLQLWTKRQKRWGGKDEDTKIGKYASGSSSQPVTQ